MPSPALIKAKKQITSLGTRNSKLKVEAKAAPKQLMLMGGLSVIGGGALCGAIEAKVGDSIMGAPVETVVGGAAILAGLLMGQPNLVFLGAGAFACYAQQATQAALQDA